MDNKKAHIVTVNMGYGHQRTVCPIKDLAFGGKLIIANNYQGIPEKDKRIWELTRRFYEFISRSKRIPLIGENIFSFYDKFQKIPGFYPKRDLSKPTLGLKQIFSLIKKGWGKDLILKLKEKPLPFITSFFIPAFMAEAFKYPGDIFCIVCDADISRSWVSLKPKKSRIKYFTPNSWVNNRLKLYGIKEKSIFLTGFPLPRENIGTKKAEVLKHDLSHRILNLDPKREYYQQYRVLIDKHIGPLPRKSDHVLTIMFTIGGAGAQKEMAIKYVKSLAEKIKKKEVKVILSAGIRKKVKEYFLKNIEKLGLKNNLNKNIEIIFSEKIEDYFKDFNQKLRKTDLLWTKPSELSFYTGLGIPIIMAPSIGSQEDFNKKWLISLGAGIVQENPVYANEWVFDYLNSGRFAEAMMDGFIEVEKLGSYNIKKICLG